MFNLLTVLNTVETKTTVDKNILFEDKEFVKNLTNLFNDPNNDIDSIINQSIEYVNNNY